MTLEDIQKRLDHIKEIAGDDEGAHASEDALRDEFIAYVATLEIPTLAEKAKLVLTSDEIQFCRWYA